MSAFIETYTGKAFYPLAPVVKDIDIWDVAHALANQCRFSGHARIHYSVAEHSVRVSDLLREWGEDRETQLWGLLHDASEAYLVDVPLPLKALPEFDGYRKAEARLMKAICLKFRLRSEQPESVGRADRVLLATEARDLMPCRPEHWRALGVPPLVMRISPWGTEMARFEFLKRFDALKEAT